MLNNKKQKYFWSNLMFLADYQDLLLACIVPLIFRLIGSCQEPLLSVLPLRYFIYYWQFIPNVLEQAKKIYASFYWIPFRKSI
jgi:hypothetical protein